MFRMEIGGDFHLCDTTSSKENPNNVFEYLNGFSAAYFDSGRSALRALLEKCSGYPNFIPSSGCDIPPPTPWENIDAFFATVKKFGENS